MSTNRSSAKSHKIRSKRKRKTTTYLLVHSYSNQHESAWRDGTRKDVTCYSCGHQGHFLSRCPRRNASFTATLGSLDGSQAETVVSEDPLSEPFDSYLHNVESRYLQDKMDGIITCMICGKEGHCTCECPMKDQEDKVIAHSVAKKAVVVCGVASKKKSESHTCTRCGEIGHSANTHGLNCSTCDEYHPHGNCRMSKVTCIICESQHHCLSQCPLNSVLTAVFQHQRENFRAAV